jgi:hypothetical protein
VARIPPFPIQEPPDNKFPADPVARWLADMFPSEGIVESGDLEVSQRASGPANLSVDVGAGDAYVEFSVPYGGMRRVRNDAASNSGTPGAANTTDWGNTFTTPDLTRPRVDRVVLEVKDDTLDGGGLFRSRFRVVAGLPRATASLASLDGVGQVPDNAILLANVLVRAGTSEITDADVDNTVRPQATLVGEDAMVLIERRALTADGTFDFLSIPQSFKHLVLIGSVKAALDQGENVNLLQVILNGDTSASYDSHAVGTFTNIEDGFNFVQSIAGPTFNRVNRTTGFSGDVNGNDQDDSDNLLLYSPVIYFIPNYLSTAAQKVVESTISSKSDFTDNLLWVESRNAVYYAKQQAIQRVQVFALAGTNFESGSQLALYGVE